MSKFNKQVEYVRGAVNSRRREMAVENLRRLVAMLKEEGRSMDPRERLNELRLRFEQALSECDAGEIGKDEASAIARDVLDDMVNLKGRFKEKEEDCPGLYSAYARAMEAAGSVRGRLHNIVSKSGRGAGDEKALQDFEEKVDSVVTYEPELVEAEEEGEEMTPMDLVAQGLEMMMQKGKAEAVQEVLQRIMKESGMSEEGEKEEEEEKPAGMVDGRPVSEEELEGLLEKSGE